MAAYNSPYSSSQMMGIPQPSSTMLQNSLQAQQFFPQPQGNVYLINNSLEVANVPMGTGLSAALCMTEGLLYLKMMQNGNPLFMAYKIVPYEGKEEKTSAPTSQSSTSTSTPSLIEERMSTLENKMNKLIQMQLSKTENTSKGGTLNELV